MTPNLQSFRRNSFGGRSVFDFVSPFVLPVVIFLAETLVVTISTVRIISVARGRKVLASLIGTVEITIWLFAIGKVMQNLSDVSCFIAFAAGFTIGNFLGVVLETKLAIGTLVVRVITNRNGRGIVAALKGADYGVTSIDAQGATGAVQVILTVIPRKKLPNVVALIKACDPKVFYSVDDLQSAAAGITPGPRVAPRKLLPSMFWPRSEAVVTG
jgi:uncharacterized protein YebE (UPF0316 family)